MKQLPLPLHHVEPPSLENFIAGGNAECVALLRRIRAGTREPRFIYLWGPAGSGRSHLLASLSPPGELVRATLQADMSIGDTPGALFLIDDCDTLDPTGQQALFALYNRVQASEAGMTLIATGRQPPLFTEVREDLRSRFGWGLVFRLQLLSDEDKARALDAHAARRGVELAPDVIPWLLTHQDRDIRHLLELLDAFDRYAFERQRALTLPLLREFAASGAMDNAAATRDDSEGAPPA